MPTLVIERFAPPAGGTTFGSEPGAKTPVPPGAGLTAVKVEDAELARYLESQGRLVRLGDGKDVESVLIPQLTKGDSADVDEADADEDRNV